ncbi:MAG: ParB domain protein nuclease [Candidatus Beckwithbacteria bacterium GW2011_GWB1_47_15]|uniref:Methyltransferase n=1 Tax=Candidatus Beckwithbacteria bacterium GW2011_GWB1_47_15 TaxID=1618371 RepID=A0A0G1RTX0_9BACT|nr:MAG: methylase protein [Candidatus Beckwithbacteria bacterium GW2011_GWC1_49_16]KKU35105.1 MAG: ParB domain protein nuclease [Candidatus Beckwithbacteria bacterium GW2011_GWA1_46_30]KKU60749.1 MAG: ParB domain protein nuclease [Candidatus Beckwithbacteria bacterium GW2011_GWB1_47_15]KKU71554.1 MAG: ParB domain protein nuclease [Candidatus Beckwithbacteria bacterium GW2011_GWA2_47_25]KKW03493.1 MAG: ParB domain protein nuclease [Candidatus Beckwithbacteria bacterium GW2011_GWC2_49_11]OGD4913
MKNIPIQTIEVPIMDLVSPDYNPRKHDDLAKEQLKESIRRFGIVDPIVANSAPTRKNIIIGGNFRWETIKELGYKTVPVVYVDISDLEKEKELNIRLNKNTGEFDWDLLAKFDESFLADIGFSSGELDGIFDIDVPEEFDLEKELKKLNIQKINVQKGDIYSLDDSKLMCGDSTIEADILKLMDGKKADMCLTDEPYLLDYVGAKRHGKPTTGFGAKRNRRYLETDVLPPNFISLWMSNIAKVAKPDFSIISYENWKNTRAMWDEIEKYWKVRNMLIWRLPNRHQGFSAKYKFFSKYDIAMVGTSEGNQINTEVEEELLQNEYETALYATSGKPHWEGYEHGKKNQPTDFIEFNASDEKHSGQGVVFGCKPTEILIPYIKMLTKRGDLIVEPFGGSGSTLIAATKMKRRCYIMEKSPVYTEVIIKRWENLTGQKAKKIYG